MKTVCMKKFVIVSLLIIVVYVYVLRPYLKKITEGFNILDKVPNDNTLYVALSRNCDKRYCDLNVWSNEEQKIPDGYVLTNYSTSSGCCIIPEKLNEYINDAKGGNEYKK